MIRTSNTYDFFGDHKVLQSHNLMECLLRELENKDKSQSFEAESKNHIGGWKRIKMDVIFQNINGIRFRTAKLKEKGIGMTDD